MAEEDQFLAGTGESIVPPRLEDAGLEDCALHPDSIAEAFALAAKAVSSRLPRLSLSDDEDEYDGYDPLALHGSCVEGIEPTRSTIPDALVGPGDIREGSVDDDVVVVGDGRVGGNGGSDKVVVVGHGDEDDRVVVVGEEPGEETRCVEGIRGQGVTESGEGNLG